jgi:FixJ family two-component response regulator
MMTAYANVPDSLAALKLGACDFLPKPIEEAALIAELREISERRAAPGTI